MTIETGAPRFPFAGGLVMIALLAFATSGGVLLAQEEPPAPVDPLETPEEDRTNPNLDEVKTVAPVDPRTYVIGAEDILVVRVWREPELSGPVGVRPDGKFTLPLVGEIQAAGQTPLEVSAALHEALLEYMKQPRVDVQVQTVNSRKYYITGQVNRSGAFPLVVPTTVMQALTQAGGFQEFANKKKVLILRGDERLTFNYNDFVKGKNHEQNITLKPGDHIVVE
jgi:polysaccharide biosynthesis/export protein